MCNAAEQEKEELVRSAYVTAEALVKRCLGNSHKLWNQMARWSQMSAPRQSAYAMTKSPPRRSASMSDAPLGGEPALCLPAPALLCFHLCQTSCVPLGRPSFRDPTAMSHAMAPQCLYVKRPSLVVRQCIPRAGFGSRLSLLMRC